MAVDNDKCFLRCQPSVIYDRILRCDYGGPLHFVGMNTCGKEAVSYGFVTSSDGGTTSF